MDRLWSRAAPTTVREIWTDLSARDLAYNTVLTVVDNLHRKGWLRRERAGRAYRYEPVSSRGEYGARLMRDAMAESGDPASALAGFVQELSPEESAELLRVLRDRP